MSRVGRLPVKIPENVTVTVKASEVSVEGPKGSMTQSFSPQVKIDVTDGQCVVTRKNESKQAKSYHGLYRNLIQNMVIGVSQGFSRTLLINGVGYRAELQGERLVLNLGYSMPIEYVVPEGVSVQTDGPNKLTLTGIDKMRVGQAAAEIRSLRPPEPYKGKGVKYEEETIVRKVGKAGIK